MLGELISQHRDHRRARTIWAALRRDLPGPLETAPDGLTICSVAFHARRCLELNALLTRRLNPETPFPQWLLYDNNVDPAEMMPDDDRRFTIVRPAARELTMGYEHALGISTLLSQVRTRFLLIQDPDCFIVRPDWIRVVLDHMRANRLAFFGTPINPQRHNSYRYFPYMVCMFVDLAQIAPRDLCFFPDVWRMSTSATYRMRRALTRVPKLGYLFRWTLTEQWRTNGWRIKQRFAGDPRVRFECAQPVWDPETAMTSPAKRLVHAITPAPISPIPKQPGYCSTRGFAATGAPDVGALGWEEFVWQSKPFACHIGSVHGKTGTYERELERIVPQFAGPTADDRPRSVMFDVDQAAVVERTI